MTGLKYAAFYLIVPALTMSYEMGIRVYDTGNSEFAGMLSALVTLPSILLVQGFAGTLFGVRAGDSNLAWIAVFGLSALTNAGLIWGAARLVGRRRDP